MSEHAWVLENLASYSAGGLEAAERDRLEQHAADCPACARALEETRAVDLALESLFAADRPQPTLEDRLIRALRAPRGPLTLPFPVKLALGAAAVLMLGVLGSFLSSRIQQG